MGVYPNILIQESILKQFWKKNNLAFKIHMTGTQSEPNIQTISK